MYHITDHILQFEEHRYGSTFYNLLQSAKNENFPYIPIVNVPVFLDDPKKEPNSRFFWKFRIYTGVGVSYILLKINFFFCSFFA